MPSVPIMAATAILIAVAIAWWALWPPSVPIVVLAGDCATRLRWRRALGHGLRRLRRLVGPSHRADLAILVTEQLPEGRTVCLIPPSQDGDGHAVTILRLALTVPGRRLRANEVLAALADQYLAVMLAPPSESGPRAAKTAVPAAGQLGALLADLGIVQDGTVQEP